MNFKKTKSLNRRTFLLMGGIGGTIALFIQSKYFRDMKNPIDPFCFENLDQKSLELIEPEEIDKIPQPLDRDIVLKQLQSDKYVVLDGYFVSHLELSFISLNSVCRN